MREATVAVESKNAEIAHLLDKMKRPEKASNNDEDQRNEVSGVSNSNRDDRKQLQRGGINYDAVQKAIEEMNRKEAASALKIQSIYRGIVARREFKVRLRVFREKKSEEFIRKQQAKQQQMQNQQIVGRENSQLQVSKGVS